MMMTNRRRPQAAFLAAAGLMAAACGGDSSNDLAAFDPIGDSLSTSSAPDDGPQYGDTVDEFNLALEDSFGDSGRVSADAAPPPGYTSIEWDQLIAPGFSSEEIWNRYADQLNAVEYGSAEANLIYDQMQAESLDAASTNPDLDGQQIQLAGFVAPVTYEGDRVTEFLLVPFFGACIHVPPPPANQTIMVKLEEGMELNDAYGMVLVTGSMSLEFTDAGIGSASYTVSSGAYRAADF